MIVKEFFSEQSLPVEKIKKAQLIQTVNGKIKVEVFANFIERFQETQPELVLSDSIVINFYNDSLSIAARLEADVAYIDNEKRIMIASGNVILKGNDKKMESEELIWNERNNSIYTEERVKITTDKEVVFGTGFISDPSFREYSISNIHGSVDFSSER